MKRSAPLPRHAGILRTTELRRTTTLPKVNRQRLAKRHARQFGAQAKLCRTLRCACCEQLRRPQSGRTVAAHLRSRGAGGLDEDTVPLCFFGCHPRLDDREGSPEAFLAATGVDLVAVRDRLRRIVAGEESGLPAPWCFLPY